jgi:hypothetical protein
VNDSPVERYLDDLFDNLRAAPSRDARSLLAEAEAHLHDLVADGQREGMTPAVAEADAVSRFGEARLLAHRDRDRLHSGLATRIAITAWALASIGAIAVGVSGLLAGLLRLAGVSTTFLVGPAPYMTLSRSDCTRWLANYPHARSCAQAASADWAWETVAYRIVVGALGLAMLGALLLVQRHRPQLRRARLPLVVVDTIGVIAFIGSGVWLAAMGIDALAVSSGHGAGQWLSAAPVALACGAVFGIRLVRQIEAPLTSMAAD